MNINAISNLFEFKYQEETYEMPNFAFDSVIIDNSKFIPVSNVEDDKVIIVPMEILEADTNGNYLLKKYLIKFVDRTDVKPFIEAEPAHYKRFPSLYYLYNRNKGLIALDNLNKLSQIDGMPKDLDSFVRKNKIKRKNENDLKLLFTFLYR